MKPDPIRLSEGADPIVGGDPDLGSLMGSDLRAARKVGRPDYDVEAGLARFSALVGPGATGPAGLGGSGTVAAKTGAAKAAAATGKGLLGVKWAVGLVAVMGVVGGTTLAIRSESAGPPATSTLTTTTTATATATATAIPTTTSTSTSTPTATATTTSTPDATSPLSSPSTDPRPSVKPEMDQMALLRQTTDPARRLALAEEGHARFPKGVFWQEREMAAIGALSQLGRAPEAKARAQAFLARHPESPYGEALRSIAERP